MRLPAFSLLLLAGLLAGCGGGGSTETPDPVVRAVNLSPGTTLDVAIDDEVLLDDAAYLGTEFPSTTQDPDTYDFTLRANDSNVDLAVEAYDLQSGANYVYAAVGQSNFGEVNARRLRGALVGYDRDSPGESKTRVIAINAFFDASVTTEPGPVVFEGPGESPSITFGGVAFGGANVQVLDSGVQTLEVRADGTEATLASATVTLQPGRTYVAAFVPAEVSTQGAAGTLQFLLIP